MKRILPLILLVLALPASAHASARQVTTFEAPRELLSASTRDETLDQITSFGVTRVRQLVYWRDFAPEPDSKTKPAGFDASDPAAYPADKWDNLDGLVASAKAQNVALTLTLTGPVPKGATKAKATAKASGQPATLSQLMKGIFFPNSNVIFAAQNDDPAKVPPATASPCGME